VTLEILLNSRLLSTGESMTTNQKTVTNTMISGEMNPLESELRRRLKPILPNNEYIQRLKSQLSRMPQIVIENKPKVTGLLIIIMGLFSSVLAFWLIRKLSKQ
jgi:hypothetical protein